MKKALILLGLVYAVSSAVLVPDPICAGCAVGGTTTYGYRSVVVVGWGSGLSGYSSSITAGMNMWNNGCGGTASGSSYPSFASSSQGATYEGQLTIAYQTGHASTAACAGGTQYCTATWSSTTRTITVYEQSGDPNNLTSLSSYTSAQLDRLFAHELGHAIGLLDDNCTNGIMNGVVPATAVIDADECATADSENNVPWEGTQYEGCLTLVDCRMSPIVVNLEKGYRLSGIDDPVWFDIDGDGDLDRMAWTQRGSDEAFLWQDLNGNGFVDDGTELFGTAMADNGFKALENGDKVDEGDFTPGGNGNRLIDRKDKIWRHLKLWVDSNHDGISQAAEIFTLNEKGVIAISLDYRRTPRVDDHGNEFRYAASIWVHGPQGRRLVGKVFDIFFVTEPN